MSRDFKKLEEAYVDHRNRFFKFIYDCSQLLGVEGSDLIEDPNWFFCFDDRMTPEQAVQEYRQNVLDKS